MVEELHLQPHSTSFQCTLRYFLQKRVMANASSICNTGTLMAIYYIYWSQPVLMAGKMNSEVRA